MAKRFFTNREGNTLMKEFEGLLEHNSSIKCLDSVVGFLRASGYFTLRPFLNSINKVRILIGIDVDKYIANAHNKGQLFFGAEEEVKQDYLAQLRKDIEHSNYSKNVEAFYITTSSSLARYIDVYGMDGLNKLCDELSIGIVCFDEFHMHWVQNVKINMAINCENTWYLTATPTRTDNGESRVFRRTMNKIPIYGQKTQTIRNDINLRLIDYNTYPTDYEIQSCMTYKGLSAINYWNYIFNNEKRRLYLLGMIKMVIDECLDKEPDGKILIYLAKNEHIKTFKEMLENLYKDSDISFGNYTGLVNKNKKRYEIRNNIIFTTIGSGGVGLDVSDLVATLSFVPYSSIIISNQMIGRLRESKTKELFHYDFIDTGFKTMYSQRVKRIHVFRQKTKSEEEIKISYQDVINYIRK